WPNSLRARRWRSRSQHWSSACSAAASLACSSAPEISPDASLVRSSCSVWMRSSMWAKISLSSIASTVSPAGPGSASLTGLVAGPQQGVGDGFLQRVPGRGDDVLVHAHRAPGAVRRAGAVPGLDEYPGHRAGAVRVLQDADLVVRQLQHRQL